MELLRIAAATLLLSGGLMADPINVTYTVTGTAGDWTLDFSVNNNLPGAPNQNLYLFGVALSPAVISGEPTTFLPRVEFDPHAWGGPDIEYNNVWLDSNSTDGHQLPGTTSDFFVTTSLSIAPDSVDWVALTVDTNFVSSYTGGGNWYYPVNPGFNGTAEEAGAPEPGTLALLACGFLALLSRASLRSRPGGSPPESADRSRSGRYFRS